MQENIKLRSRLFGKQTGGQTTVCPEGILERDTTHEGVKLQDYLVLVKASLIKEFQCLET
jgi:hypothetical protein